MSHHRKSQFVLPLLSLVVVVPTSPAAEPGRTRDKWNVAVVVHENVELLDFAGPGEVFTSAAGGRAFNVYAVAETDKPVRSQRFLTITPQYTIANCPPPDIVVIPGGATQVLLRSPAFMNWVRATAPKAEVMFSVCTGAFVLADAGLLDGLEATTHHGSIARLKRYQNIKVHDDRKVVDNGKIVTAAGVSAGIEGALHLVARLCGPEAAKGTAKYMEYRWQPEEPAVKPTPEQAAAFAWFAGDWAKTIDGYQAIVRQQPGDGVAYGRLGYALSRERRPEAAAASLQRALDCGHRSAGVYANLGNAQLRLKRNAEAVTSFEKAVELGAQDGVIFYDLACAYARTGRTEPAIGNLEKSFAASMSNAGHALTDPDLQSVRGDPRCRKLIREHSRDSKVTMVTRDEPGERLVVTGVIRGADGEPLPGSLVYVYHTDARGIYADGNGNAPPRLFGYLRTDAQGRYEYRTIRPATYPNTQTPQHVHYEVSAPGHQSRNSELLFADDPLLTGDERERGEEKGTVSRVTRDADGTQRCTHDVRLKKA